MPQIKKLLVVCCRLAGFSQPVIQPGKPVVVERVDHLPGPTVSTYLEEALEWPAPNRDEPSAGTTHTERLFLPFVK